MQCRDGIQGEFYSRNTSMFFVVNNNHVDLHDDMVDHTSWTGGGCGLASLSKQSVKSMTITPKPIYIMNTKNK